MAKFELLSKTNLQAKILGLLIFVYYLVEIGEYFTSIQFNGATCAYVKNTVQDDGDAEVAVRLNRLLVDEKYDSSSLRFPVLIFKYTDRENFTNLPSLDEFRKYYESDDIEFGNDFIDNDRFKLDLASGQTLNEQDIYNDYIMLYNSSLKGTPHMRASFKVQRSGLYCAYVVTPQIDGPKRHIQLGVNFKNSFGDLSFYGHLLSVQLKYLVIVGAAAALYLNFHILRFRDDPKEIFNTKVVSSISCSVTRLFTAMVLIDVLLLVGLNFRNATFEVLMVPVPFYLKILEFATYYFVFTMFQGYGTITPITVSKNERNPIIIQSLFVYVISLMTLNKYIWGDHSMLETNVYMNNYNSHFFSKKFMDGLISPLLIALEVLPVVCIIIAIIYFFKTKKNMESSGNTRYLIHLEYSLILLVVSPIISTAISSVAFNAKFIEILLFRDSYDLIPSILQGKLVYYDIVTTSASEVRKLDSSLNLASIWSRHLTIFANVFALFFIWIKENKGLPIEVNSDDENNYVKPIDDNPGRKG